MPGAFPDQRLVCSSNHFHRFSLGAVGCDRAQLMRVGTDHVSEAMRVGRIALGAGNSMPLPVPGRLQWIGRVHGVASRNQCCHPRAAVSLDPNQYLGLVRILTPLSTDHRVQPGQTYCPLGQPRLGQHPAGLIHQLDVVMILGPIVSHAQQFASPITLAIIELLAAWENSQRPNERVLTPHRVGTTSHQRSLLPANQRGRRSEGRTRGPGTT